MRSVVMRVGTALCMLVMLAVSDPVQRGGVSANQTHADIASQVVASELIYAAQNDGTIHVYDIDDHHRQVKVISVFSCCADVRGITAAVPTHQLYVMYNRDNQGH